MALRQYAIKPPKMASDSAPKKELQKSEKDYRAIQEALHTLSNCSISKQNDGTIIFITDSEKKDVKTLLKDNGFKVISSPNKKILTDDNGNDLASEKVTNL